MRESMLDKNYALCGSQALSADAVLLKYTWKTLDCQPPSLSDRYKNRLIDYDFYGARLEGTATQIIDSWSAIGDFDQDRFNISYQLLDEGWYNVAQLDLPLVHEGKLRQFSIGVADLPAGAYRLVAIVYDNQTGDTIDWIDNPGYVPGMLELSEVVIQE